MSMNSSLLDGLIARKRGLNPDLSTHVADILSELRSQGHDVRVGDVKRTPEQQARKVAEGRSWTLKSKHLDGDAADLIVFKNDQPDWDTNNPAWQSIGAAAKKRGLTWGGDFKDKRGRPRGDYGHVQAGKPQSLVDKLIQQKQSAPTEPQSPSSVVDKLIAAKTKPSRGDYNSRAVQARNPFTPPTKNPFANAQAGLTGEAQEADTGGNRRAPDINQILTEARQSPEAQKGFERRERIRKEVTAPRPVAPQGALVARAMEYISPRDNEAEIESRVASEREAEYERNRLVAQFTDADKAEIASFTEHLKGKGSTYTGVRTGARSIGSGMLYKLAGLTDLVGPSRVSGQPAEANPLGEWLRRKALAGELSVEDIPAEQRGQVAEFLTQMTLGLAEIAVTPGGPIAKFAGLAGTESVGRGRSARETAKETVKGGTIGAVFKNAGRLSRPAETVRDRAANLAKEGTAIGTGTYGVEKAFGTPDEDALLSAATNVGLHGVLGARRLRGNAKEIQTQARATDQTRQATSAEVSPIATERPIVNSGEPQRDGGGVPVETPQRFQHLQFGEVEVIADQSGARPGRLKVAEVSDPSKQHFVKKSDMQGRGNARMIPVREVPPAVEAAERNQVRREFDKIKESTVSQPSKIQPADQAELERRADEITSERPEETARREAELGRDEEAAGLERDIVAQIEGGKSIEEVSKAAGFHDTRMVEEIYRELRADQQAQPPSAKPAAESTSVREGEKQANPTLERTVSGWHFTRTPEEAQQILRQSRFNPRSVVLPEYPDPANGVWIGTRDVNEILKAPKTRERGLSINAKLRPLKFETPEELYAFVDPIVGRDLGNVHVSEVSLKDPLLRYNNRQKVNDALKTQGYNAIEIGQGFEGASAHRPGDYLILDPSLIKDIRQIESPTGREVIQPSKPETRGESNVAQEAVVPFGAQKSAVTRSTSEGSAEAAPNKPTTTSAAPSLPTQTDLSRVAVNESPETMQKKAEMVNQAKVPAMLYNPGQEVLPHRKGLAQTKTEVGTWVHDSSKVSARKIKAKVADGTYHELLGITEAKGPETTRVVTARAKDGTEIESAAISPENEAAQAKVYQERSPEATIETGTGENVIRDRVALKPLSTGKESTVSTERGTEVKSKYAIVEAADLVTSHDSALNRNPAFPEELQPRERDRAASAAQIDRIARNPRGERLGESPMASEGAPITGPDGIVESGNGRVLGLRKAYESGKAEDYRTHLIDNADKFGIDPASVKDSKEPVLVRIRQSEVDRPQFVREANETGVASMSAPEQAKSDGQRLTGELLSTFSPSESGEINTTANSNFIRAFMRDVVGPSELGRYVSAKGEVSQEGLTRIRNAIFARAYGDSPEGLRALEKLAESPDNNVRNITNALLQRAGQFASLKEGIAKGERYPLDVTADLSKALAKLSNLREQEMTVKDYLNQGDLFGADLTPLQKQALWAFDEYKRSTKAVSAILDNYARGAEAAGNPKQANFFGNETPQKEALFDAAVREAVEDGNRQVGLFATENQRTQIEPEARQRVPAPDTAVQEGTGKAAEVKERNVEPDRAAKPRPSFVEEAIARDAANTKFLEGGGKKFGSGGPDTQVLIDKIIIKGWDLYSQKVRPTFEEWSRKIREEFGPESERHLRRVWAQLGGEKTMGRPTTSVKNAATAELRDDLGLLQMERPEHKSWETSIRNAEAKGIDRQAEAIADRVIKGGREEGLDLEESAGILIKTRELENQWEDLYRKNPNDPELVKIKDRLDRLSQAVDMGGTDPARTLNFRRAHVDKEFRLISMIKQAEQSKGRKVTPEETARYDSIVKERDKAITERDAALEQLHSKRLQQELDKATRSRARTRKKEVLDQEAVLIRQNIVAEFARLKSQQGNIRSMGGLGGLDPEGVITKNLLRYARNRVEANIGLKAEALIDDAHSLVSDFGITRRQVAEALSGYGRMPVDKRGEAARQLAAIRSEINSMLSAEDVAAGRRTLKQEGPKRELVRNQKRFDQLVKQEAEWGRKLNERDFEPKPKAEPYPYNSEVRKAEDRVRIAEAKFKREMQRAAPGHSFRNASGILKAWLLSGPPTQAMNIAGTGSYQVFREVARLPAAIGDIVWSQTGARAFGNRGQRSITGPSPSAMLDSVVQAGKVGGRDFLEIMKHGATKEQMERHQYQEIDFGVNTGKKAIDNGVKIIELAHNAVFRMMSGSDRVFYQGAYKRNLIDRAKVQAKNEGVSDVKLRTKELVDNAPDQLAADAKHDALVSTFNNNNWLSTKIKRARSAVVEKESLMSKKNAERLNAAENFALDFILPFDRTPTNVVSRIVEASPLGYGKNASQLVAAAMRKSMPVEHQRQMMQTFGNATAGTALMGLGWYLGDQAKELIQIEKYDVYLKIPGLPRINLRTASPAGNILAVGARMRAEHDKGDATAGDYAKPALREALNIPVLRATSPITEMARDPERSAPKTAARFASMAVPFGGAVRWAGKAMDPAENRFPDSSFKQQFQKGIPIWRQSLPDSTEKLTKEKYTEAYRKKEISSADLDRLVQENKISRSDADGITKAGGMSDFQYRFSNLRDGSKVLDRYENMDERQRFQVKEIMAKKAWTMTRSEAYTETEKANFKKRIQSLGIQEQNPKEQSGADVFKFGSESFKTPAAFR